MNLTKEEMFDVLDSERSTKNKDKTLEMKEALYQNNVLDIANNLYNDFEIITNKYPEIIDVKNDFEKTNALRSMLSGSGSCVFGVYESKKKAKKAYKILKEKYEAYYVVSF